MNIYITETNKSRSSGMPYLTNDPTLKQMCLTSLDQIDADGWFDRSAIQFIVNDEGTPNATVTSVYISCEDPVGSKLKATPLDETWLETWRSFLSNSWPEITDTYLAIGAAYKVINGNVYTANAVKMPYTG